MQTLAEELTDEIMIILHNNNTFNKWAIENVEELERDIMDCILWKLLANKKE